MELVRLIEALTDPRAYLGAAGAEAVAVRQTHISVVFLTGRFAYKIKKPVDLGFVDYRSLDQRRHFCEQEVQLNRRLARDVYVGVVPVTADAGGVRMEGEGEAIDWAVKMVRLPNDATLRERLRRGEVGPEQLEVLARRLASFHAQADGSQAVAAYARFEVVAANARENLDQATAQVGTTLHRAVLERLRTRFGAVLQELRPLIDSRAARGVARDGHGDLRLVHIYLFPDRAPPDDLVVIDCIEFNDRFRCADPVADIAFPVMDLSRIGRRDLARAFANEYFRAANDAEGRALLRFYVAYRAAVRGKVDGLEWAEPEVPEAERAAGLVRARAHWLLALGELEEAGQRPGLVLVAGLPGTGKSTLSRSLAARAGFEVIRTDVVRKELACTGPTSAAGTEFEGGIYSPAWTERTYHECLRRAESLLFEGKRVLIDASFRAEVHRRLFLDAAARWSVPTVMLHCCAPPEVVRERLAQRRSGPSDADWTISRQVAERWEPVERLTETATRAIKTGGSIDAALAQALEALREFGMA